VATEIVMPRLSDSMEDGTVLQWFVSEGDPVVSGEPLVEVETDKASVTYESEVDGTVLAISVPAGESAAVGAVIAVVGQPGEKVAPPPTRSPSSRADGPAPTERNAPPEREFVPEPSSPPGSTGSTGSTGSAERLPLSAERANGAGRESVSARPGQPGRAKASPLARRVAAELDVDLSTVAGTGHQGRVVRADVERAAASVALDDGAGTPRPDDALAAGRGAPVSAEGARRPLTRMQQTIARRMAQSRATVPDFELRAEVDMTELVTLREQLRAATDSLPSYNDFIVRAVALALREFPRVNGSYRDAQIEEHAQVNVGIAVAGEETLVVPTIFNADAKSVRQIAAASRELAAKVRDGSISPGELAGGTFTVSNLGMYGVDSFSAVINAPQAAILAVGSLRMRAVADEDGTILARRTVHLSLACDHRILYGADGARFLHRVRELLEHPACLLL
jgi:pyruvate dehydrogenase E2 component (dihydrolipoamide acetyltransferase)